MSLQEDFAKGIDNYPKTIQEAEKYLDKFPKNTPPATASEGTAFAQKGAKTKNGGKQDKEKKGDGELKPYNKKFFADKECFNCGKLGHPADSCPNQAADDDKPSKKGKARKKDEDDDNASVSSIKKLEKGFKKMQKTLTQISDKIDEGNESDLSEEDSHFQFAFAHVVMNAGFPKTANVLKQSHNSLKGLDMTEIILLDSQSTICVFCNKNLLVSIKKATRPLRLHSNGGSMLLTKQATIKNYKHKVWYSPDAITNIFSLKQVKKQYRVTYDSDDECFVVHRQEYGLPDMVFREHVSGLHYFDPRNQNKKFSFVETVMENKTLFTKRQIKGAENARRLYKCLSHPSIDDFKLALRTNCIKDSPVTVADVIVAQKVYGPDIAVLKGKTTRKSAPAVVVEDLIPVPKHLINMHKNVTLAVDICFVNKIPFFVTLSRNICFTTATHLSNRTLKTIFKAFRGVFNFYYKHGFRITMVMADGEFAALQTLLVDIIGAPNLNLTAANEHEPFIERRIRVIKERVRALRYTLPFRNLPKKMVANMVLYVTKLLNFFPAKNGLSDTLSPKAIVTGEHLNYKHYNLPFGSYCQVHEETHPRNNMAARTLGAISLGSSGNMQGAQRFLSLKTGEVIVRYSWTEVPMPDEVIQRVNYFGRDQPEQLTFADRHGVPIGDHDPAITGVANDATNNNDNNGAGVHDDDAELPGVDVGDDDADNEADLPLPDIFEADDAPPDVPDLELNLNEPNIVQPEPQLIEHQPNDEILIAAPLTAPEQPNENGPRRSTRVRRQEQRYAPIMKGNRYHYASTQLTNGVLYPDSHMFMQEEFYEHDIDVVQAVMTQLSLKAALREWGSDAKNAAFSEAKQLHWRNSFKPVHRRELTADQRKQILESHMFVVKKKDGTVKAHEVAGGNKQQDFVSKEDASSPTAATESVLLSCAVDAKENRETAVLDIPNAFIQTVVKRDKDKAIVRIRGLVADMLLEIAPEVYSEYVTKDKRGNSELLVICLNALYGTMVAALLFYEKFTDSLKSKGFSMNPYDPCVWNKIVNGKQLTIVFHVDDCKLSHVDSKVLDDTIEWLRRDYESIFEDGSGRMKVSRGRKHKYLGMDLDFSARGLCKITMFGYVEDILAAWNVAEKIPDSDGFQTASSRRKKKTSAAPENLFVIDEDCKKLDPVKAKTFHNIVAKALYVMKRARPDISVAIAFLTTRVRAPDQQDWDKLSHLMQYLYGTKDLPLILGADGTGIIKWFVDASFAVHPNMRSHTGGAVTLGRGCPIVTSTKQKLNTRSSTESELVGVDDLMPSILWTRKFLKAQGYDVSENILYQDNKSSILLEKNGKASSSKRTRHISIRYFFVTDRIAKGELTIEWCPTANMIADFMTKPLQGALFRKFRDIVMGTEIIKPGKDVSNKKSDEEVGKSKSRPVQATKSRKVGKSLARY